MATHGGFSRAADVLFLTQPAISDQVRKLEAENDVRLFDRHSKKVVLTPAGENLLQITRRMFEAEESVADFLSESRSIKTGQLNVMADSVNHITDTLLLFRQRYPAVFISLKVGNTQTILNKLRNYDADVAVLGSVPKSQEYAALRLNSTPIVAFVAKSSNLIEQSTISLNELGKLPLVLREKGSITRAKLEAAAAESGIDLNAIIETQGREAVREIVLAGGGVGVVSEAEFGSGDGLRKVPISGKPMMMDEALVYLRERKDSKLIRAFMEGANEMNA